MWLNLDEAISTWHDDGIFLFFNLVISLVRQTDTVIKRGPRFGFCRFSVFSFRSVLAKKTSFGHVFFVVTPTILAMPVSLR